MIITKKREEDSIAKKKHMDDKIIPTIEPERTVESQRKGQLLRRDVNNLNGTWS